MTAYLARPRAEGRYAAVMICHENQGTGEHFRDVARRYAKNGYVGLHLDLLSHQGGTTNVPVNQRAANLSGPGKTEQFVADFQAAMAYLRRQPFVLGDRIGMTGYCFGGGVTWNVATKEPTLRAAVPYYGTPAFRDEVGNIKAPILALYGQLDERTTSTGLAAEPALAAARVVYKYTVYPEAGHAFFNDTSTFANGFGYVESAATTAWRDTLAWFGTYLRGAGLPATGDGSDDTGATEVEATEN